MRYTLPFIILLSCSTQESIEEVSNLDNVDSIVWQEVKDDTIIIWTEEDEKRADIERFNYIYSLDTTVWEKPLTQKRNGAIKRDYKRRTN